MKILCFIDSLGSGGAQRQMVELAKGFREKGHVVVFLTYHDNPFFKPELDAMNIPVKTVIEPKYLKRIFKIRKAIRSEKPDAVLSFLEPVNFMATIAGFPFRKWKLVVGERSANPEIYRKLKKITFRWFHLFADHVVANSEENLKMVKNVSPFLNRKKCHVIYNIVNTPTFNVKNRSSGNITNIVIAASYRKVKNGVGLIQAVHKLPQVVKNRLVINWFGDVNTEYYNEMRELIDKNSLNETIKLNSNTNKIFDKYFDADYVGLFSFHEGFPNTICEAMKVGRPVIVTDVSDIPYFIEDGVNGYVCNSHDINSISQAILNAVNTDTDTKVKMGQLNQVIADEKFAKPNIITSYLNLLSNEK